MAERQVIALAGGTGDLGRYIHEELVKDPRYSVALLTRKTSPPLPTLPHTTIHTTDYSLPSILQILNSTRATALISTIRCDHADFVEPHKALVNACVASATCKRFIPSEWAGDIESFPSIPRFYAQTRGPLREYLKSIPQGDLQWTLFNLGWFMEYFIPARKSYMKLLPGEFPFDLEKWTFTVRGGGDVLQSCTFGRDVGRAVAVLLGVKEWEPVTYVSSEWYTMNEAAAKLEKFHGRPFTRTHRTIEEINAAVAAAEKDPSTDPLELAQIEQWEVSGATACPREKTLRQREKYFSGLKFVTIEEMLKMGVEMEHV
ncbi:NAD(P)-binding protein [Aspergillus carlsbadensis]|nr:NAD(P)-binding protein [Aspergillus carlsbadensis]